MDYKLTFIDLFCGMGTARMGFEKAGWECVYSVEWDRYDCFKDVEVIVI